MDLERQGTPETFFEVLKQLQWHATMTRGPTGRSSIGKIWENWASE